MKLSLRKGYSSVYLQYEHTGESIGAELFEASIDQDVAVFSFKLKPIDSNQKSDEDNLHELELESATIDDDHIITKFADFFKSKSFDLFQMHIQSKGKLLKFDVAQEVGKLNGLTFNVSNKNS